MYNPKLNKPIKDMSLEELELLKRSYWSQNIEIIKFIIEIIKEIGKCKRGDHLISSVYKNEYFDAEVKHGPTLGSNDNIWLKYKGKTVVDTYKQLFIPGKWYRDHFESLKDERDRLRLEKEKLQKENSRQSIINQLKVIEEL